MDRLIKALPAILKLAGESDDVTEAACFAAWKYAAGEGLRNHTVPTRYYEKTLVVAVGDAIWQKQLQTVLGQLRFRLNSILGQPMVSRIDLRVDPDILTKFNRSQVKQKKAVEELPVELLSAASAIADANLRRAFLGAAAQCLNRLEKSEN
jgi:hypothetical protein